jgi:zinc transport system substrate-binding protein
MVVSTLTGTATAQPKVVVTIKPVHALLLQIMRGVAEPTLLVRGSSSPHTYALIPSDVMALSHADVFVRVSPATEPFTQKLAGTLSSHVEVVTLIDTPGLKLFATRQGPIFNRAGTLYRVHQAGSIDGHAWLDPSNAQVMVEHLARVLSSKDPANAETFRSNANALKNRLDDLTAELNRVLEPVATRPYVVSHDALQYFERRFRLNAVGSIAISPEIPPSGKRLVQLRESMKSVDVACVFAEPQTNGGLIGAVVEGTGARVGTLDPEAIALAPGPDLYFRHLRSLAADLTRCLATPV